LTLGSFRVILLEITGENAMVLQLPPELERRVVQLATDTHRDPQAVLAELVDGALDDETAFRAAVREGTAQLDRGEGVPHEQVMADLRAILVRHARPQ
jgi:predicted transcriptional regulator